MLGWIIGSVILGVFAIAFLQHLTTRGVYRPLSSRMPSRERNSATDASVPLGMEAIDLNTVRRASRRNESLERSTSGFSTGSGLLPGRAAADSIEPMADDETYAKRYYSAFIKEKTKD